jgi:hypothetical protein
MSMIIMLLLIIGVVLTLLSVRGLVPLWWSVLLLYVIGMLLYGPLKGLLSVLA